jgi:hypothetical protein
MKVVGVNNLDQILLVQMVVKYTITILDQLLIYTSKKHSLLLLLEK